MKRLFLSTLLIFLTALSVKAARALTELVSVKQPDGTMLSMMLHGDEHLSWRTTADGILLVAVGEGLQVASIDDNGRLMASGQLAHNVWERDARELQVCQLQQQRRHLFNTYAERKLSAARRAQVTSTYYFPHTGSPRCLVILVNFSDVKFASDDPTAQFNQYFNGETQADLGHNESKNLVSVRKYFEQSSQGKFTPQFDIVGPVTLSQPAEYYGKNSSDKEGADQNFQQFCSDAISLVDDDIDFNNYVHHNKAGAVELICIIYAGYGESIAENPANTIWPKCGSINVSTNDGVSVSMANCSPELCRLSTGTDINGIGLFCHEFSHGLGLPDLYPTNLNARIDNQTPEFWDLMDYGEYANNGYAPVPYTAWEQEAMGWIEIEQLSTTQRGITMKSLMSGEGKACKFGNGANGEEWFILENVQPRNKETKVLGFVYGHGLLVTHIAYRSNKVAMNDYPNNTPGTPRVCIVPADSLVINGYRFVNADEQGNYHPTENEPYTAAEYTASLRGDPFPGTTGTDSLTAAMKRPNFVFYNGEETPICYLKNIKETDGVVTFDFIDGTTTGIRTVGQEPMPNQAYFYTIDGRRLQGKPARRGLYINSGRLVLQR